VIGKVYYSAYPASRERGELAVVKGHNYRTMVYSLEIGDVIGIIDGRTKEDVMDFSMTIYSFRAITPIL